MNIERPLAETDPVWEAIIRGKVPFRMDAGEASWASWKNDGGPHQQDQSYGEVTIMTIKPVADIVSRVVIPYDGTETASSAALTPQTPSTYMANLMA